MSAPEDGGPAFPQPSTGDGYAANSPYGIAGGGLSLRDYFAAHALTGLIEKDALFAQSQLMRDDMDQDRAGTYHPPRESVYDTPDCYGEIAAGAYALADAMLAERRKGAGE